MSAPTYEFIPTLHELWQLAYAAGLVIAVFNALAAVFFCCRFLIDGIKHPSVTRLFVPPVKVVDLDERRQQLRGMVTGQRIH